VVFQSATLASLLVVSNQMGPPAPPQSTYGCGGGVATLPCAGAMPVGPITAHVPAGIATPYSSTSSGTLKPQMTSNGYVAMTPRPPSQAGIPATLVPQVSDETNFAFSKRVTRLHRISSRPNNSTSRQPHICEASWPRGNCKML